MISETHKKRHHSEETKRKISQSLISVGAGKNPSEETRAKRSESLKKAHNDGKFLNRKKSPQVHWIGRKHTPETIEKMRQARVLNNPMHKADVVKKRSDTLIKRGTYKGEKNNTWKGGITPINTVLRNSKEYKCWREAVFARDEHTCKECGEKSRAGKMVYLNAHHIKPFATHPELRLDLNNGVTLCKPCHDKKPKGKTVYGLQ